MRGLTLAVALLALVGCQHSSRLTGSEHKDSAHIASFYRVSCCTDNNDTGHPTYPTFLPAAQVQLCQNVEAACHGADCQMNGDTYIPMTSDCGHFPDRLGDQYYVGKGY